MFIESADMQQPEFLANAPNRCYVCKRSVLGAILAVARRRGFDSVAHGANRDDLRDDRTGMKTAEELGVLAPLVAAGWGKAEIRMLSRRSNLSSRDRPSMACLAFRIP